jgi:hypothetical protein
MSLQRSAARAAALSALALCLCMPTLARADQGTTLLDENLATYMAIAHSYWGGPIPTCVENGVTVVLAHAILYDDPDPSVAARSMQPGCEIGLDRGHWRSMRPAEACMIVVHEWGHLLGHDHSPDPLDLMAEMPIVPPRRCAALGHRAPRARASARRAASCVARAKRARRRPRACVRHAFS